MTTLRVVSGRVCGLLLMVAALLLFSQCIKPNPSLVIGITGHTFSLPDQVSGGMVTVKLVNDSDSPKHAQLLRLNEPVEPADFVAALQAGPQMISQLATYVGGPGTVAPKHELGVQLRLAAGWYVVMSFLPDETGKPGFMNGEIAFFEVVAPEYSMAEPVADVTISMREFSFEMPDSVLAGPQVWAFENAGVQPHEFVLLKLGDGKSLQEILDFFETPADEPPFAFMGGMQALDPGLSGWIGFNLEPGKYVAICIAPDSLTGIPHAMSGMIRQFEVH